VGRSAIAHRYGAGHTEGAQSSSTSEPAVSDERTVSRLAVNGLRLGFLVLVYAIWGRALTVRSVDFAEPAILALMMTALTGVPALIWVSRGLAKIRGNRGQPGQQALAAAGLAIGLFVIGVAGLYLLTGLIFFQFLQDNGDRHYSPMHRLSLALLNYADDHRGRLPPAILYDENDRPLHSWRVLILPYIDEEELYKEFHLDEPWDSEHNIKLLPRMPAAYAAPGSKKSKLPPYHTVCHVFVGKGAAFEGREGLLYPAAFSDGTNQTILVIEAGEPIPWTKPEELVYDPNGPLPELRGLYKKGFMVGLADGSDRFVLKEVSERTLRAAITRNGDDCPGLDW
jgi:hypothetical protein